jgi:acyl carrier protein
MASQRAVVGAIQGIIVEQLDLARAARDLGPDTLLFHGGLELDSFGIVELISALETHFSFEFEEADFQEEHFRSIGTLGALVARYLNDGPPP